MTVASATCCHSNANANANSQNRLGRFVRRMRRLGDMCVSLQPALGSCIDSGQIPDSLLTD